VKKSKQIHAVTIRAYDAQTDKYSVIFQNGRTVECELEQVCKMWGKGKNRQQWSQVDQEALGCLVLRVHGHVVSDTSHTLCTPFPTLLSSSVWTDTQIWYTCSVRWSLPPDIQNMLSIMGKAQDAKIAERQCYSRKQSSGCQGTHGPNGRRHRHRTDSDSLYRLSVGQPSDANGTTVLMVWSLHRDEFHRHGDIHVTSLCTDIFLRRIAGLKRDALMMSLSGAE